MQGWVGSGIVKMRNELGQCREGMEIDERLCVLKLRHERKLTTLYIILLNILLCSLPAYLPTLFAV